MTTVRMVLTKSTDQNLAQRCAIAGELLDSLSTIPTIYVQATSTAMVGAVVPPWCNREDAPLFASTGADLSVSSFIT